MGRPLVDVSPKWLAIMGEASVALQKVSSAMHIKLGTQVGYQDCRMCGILVGYATYLAPGAWSDRMIICVVQTPEGEEYWPVAGTYKLL